jgi:hypothetical protein
MHQRHHHNKSYQFHISPTPPFERCASRAASNTSVQSTVQQMLQSHGKEHHDVKASGHSKASLAASGSAQLHRAKQ